MKEQYLRSVRSLLDCPADMRRQLTQRLQGAVSTYLEDHPDADQADLVRTFGTPAVCAAELLSEHYPAAVAVQQKKQHRMRLAMALLAVVLALALCAAGYLWSNGGLVVIEHTHYADGIPAGFPTGGTGSITYQLDN